jgi:hypothetical protein
MTQERTRDSRVAFFSLLVGLFGILLGVLGVGVSIFAPRILYWTVMPVET